jgi:exportin-5
MPFANPVPYRFQCGLMLCRSENADMVRHFGLKLLEETIRLHWNEMPPDQKLFMKENAMRLMETGVADLISEALHIKDAISR